MDIDGLLTKAYVNPPWHLTSAGFIALGFYTFDAWILFLPVISVVTLVLILPCFLIATILCLFHAIQLLRGQGRELSQYGVGNSQPERHIAVGNVRHDCLAKDEERQHPEVNAVNGAIDDQVVCDAEKNQQVHTRIEQIARQDPLRKAAKPRRSERAGRDQHQASVQLRFLTPIYS